MLRRRRSAGGGKVEKIRVEPRVCRGNDLGGILSDHNQEYMVETEWEGLRVWNMVRACCVILVTQHKN